MRVDDSKGREGRCTVGPGPQLPQEAATLLEEAGKITDIHTPDSGGKTVGWNLGFESSMRLEKGGREALPGPQMSPPAAPPQTGHL